MNRRVSLNMREIQSPDRVGTAFCPALHTPHVGILWGGGCSMFRSFEFAVEPGAGVGPVAFGGGGGEAEDGGGFGGGKAGEVFEFYEFGLEGVGSGEFLEGFVDGQKFGIGGGRGDFEVVEGDV